MASAPKISDRYHALISRELAYSAPITIAIADNVLGIALPLEDFLAELVEAVGNPITLVTKAQLLAKLTAAAGVVTEAMKAETARVM